MRISDWSSDVCSSDLIVAQLHRWIDDEQIDCVISTGGTGVTGRDVTPEAFARVWDKDIPGFGELFRWLSYQSIGTSTIQSRACAGVARGTYLLDRTSVVEGKRVSESVDYGGGRD